MTQLRLMHGDCLDVLSQVETGSVDMILADLPYGTTACSWDVVIPFSPLWAHYKRIAKPNAAIVLTSSQPFTTALIASNEREFRYCWIWDKKITSGFMSAKSQPLRAHEDICVFYRETPAYFPQMVERTEAELSRLNKKATPTVGGEHFPDSKWSGQSREKNALKNPNTVIRIAGLNNNHPERAGHPTQKPIALMDYLIRTYTRPGDVVLDNVMGSGTTGVTAYRLGRQFIGIEREREYFNVACRRLDAEKESAGMLAMLESAQPTCTVGSNHPTTAKE